MSNHRAAIMRMKKFLSEQAEAHTSGANGSFSASDNGSDIINGRARWVAKRKSELSPREKMGITAWCETNCEGVYLVGKTSVHFHDETDFTLFLTRFR